MTTRFDGLHRAATQSQGRGRSYTATSTASLRRSVTPRTRMRRPVRVTAVHRRRHRADRRCARRRNGAARVGQARQYLRRGEVLRRDLAGHGALLDACVHKHARVFAAAPVPLGMPLRDGGQQRGDEVARGHRFEPRSRARPEQRYVVLPDLRQQDREIVTDTGGSTMPAGSSRAATRRTGARVGPDDTTALRRHVTAHDDRRFQRAHVRVLPGNADTPSNSTSARHTASPGDAAIVISRSISLRGFIRRRALSRTDASAAASCRDAVRSQRTRRTRQPAGRQLDGNDRRAHVARLARDLREAQRCKAARRAHAAILPSA